MGRGRDVEPDDVEDVLAKYQFYRPPQSAAYCVGIFATSFGLAAS